MKTAHENLFRRPLRPATNRRAMVLVIVLIIVVMVSMAAFSFVATMHNEDKATRLSSEECQAEQLVRSGEELMRAVLEMPVESRRGLGDLEDNSRLFRAVLVYDDQINRQRGRFSIISRRLNQERPGGIRFGLTNESAKLHLATLMQWDEREPGAASRALMQLPGMTEPVADAILDWMDEDESPRPFGAESEVYRALDPPYVPRNGIVDSLEELLLIRGVTRLQLHGWDLDRNFRVDAEEARLAEMVERFSGADDRTASLPWSSLLTVYSAERNVNSQGRPRINLNDSDLPELRRRLQRELNSSVANFVVAYRQFGPYSGDEDANTPAGAAVDLTRPASARIDSPLDLVGARVQIPTDDESPQIVGSPLVEGDAAFDRTLLELFDKTTVSDERILRGRININRAPPPVLRAIPGMGRTAARRILQARDSLGSGDEERRSQAVWLLLEGIVDLEEMKRLLPYLTCGGDVFGAQIVGFFDADGPTARAEVVLDATRRPAQQVYWEDLRIFGTGYSWSTLGRQSIGDERDRPQSPGVDERPGAQ